jgi:glycosyltransferase involved in cell wall biosynthesis
MRILINALSARLGGGQTYLYNLLRFLPRENTPEIYLLTPDSLSVPNGQASVRRISFPHAIVTNPVLRAIWERLRLPRLLRDLKIDVLFCPGGVVNARLPGDCRAVTMFRNMIPFDLTQRRKYPLGYMRVRNWLLQRAMLRSMLQADLVIFVSRFAKQVVEQHARQPLRQSVVIPHGISPQFRVADDAHLPRLPWLPREGYLLYVSTLDYYKAQVEVIQAYAMLRKLRKTPEKLVLIGAENPDYGRKVRAEVERLDVKDAVVFPGLIPYQDLPAVYHHASVSIFASECENCPNILLEAMAAGRPVFASSRPPMPEFGGDSVVYFDPAQPEDLAEKLVGVIDDADRMRQLSKQARKRSGLYDWPITARRTWKAIENLSIN